MSSDWLCFLLLASNVAWTILCFLLDAREWKKRALRAEGKLSQNRRAHTMMLGQLDEILHQLKRVKLGAVVEAVGIAQLLKTANTRSPFQPQRQFEIDRFLWEHKN